MNVYSLVFFFGQKLYTEKLDFPWWQNKTTTYEEKETKTNGFQWRIISSREKPSDLGVLSESKINKTREKK